MGLRLVVVSKPLQPLLQPIVQPLQLNVLGCSDHNCYILKSQDHNKSYIGYTVDFNRRLRQHNGHLVGGAKKTKKWRPWVPVCVINGFENESQGLRFEARMHYHERKLPKNTHVVDYIMKGLNYIINNGDGAVERDDKRPWPFLTIYWHIPGRTIAHPRVTNIIAY